jgi:hypothetical protein
MEQEEEKPHFPSPIQFPPFLKTEQEEVVSTNEQEKQTETCAICDNSIVRVTAQLVRHSKIHYPTKRYQCASCLYTAHTQFLIRRHFESKHSDKKETLKTTYKDRVTNAIRKDWDDLKVQCFPNYFNVRRRFISEIAEATIGGGSPGIYSLCTYHHQCKQYFLTTPERIEHEKICIYNPQNVYMPLLSSSRYK